jgi:transcriptional regulator with XRE-family HTH domain
MQGFGDRLRKRARLLGMSDAEVARRIGLGERRYAHYVADTREPDLATLVKICRTLDVTPNELLGVTDMREEPEERERLVSELLSVIRPLSDDGLRIAIRQSAVLMDFHRADPVTE